VSATTPAAPLPAIGPHSRLTLCRIVISRHEKDFSVRQFGTGTGLVTGRVGVEAVRLLERGLAIGEVAQQLARTNGSATDGIDLSRIIAALFKARLIRAVDGVPASPEARPGLAAWWRYEGFPRLWKRVCEWASVLPFGWLQATMAAMEAFYVNPKRDLILATMAANMTRAFPDRSADAIRRMASGCFDTKVRIARRRYVAQMGVGPRLVGESDARARQAADWFMGRTALEGREHLEAARARGQGVILCGYHFGFILSLPFVLSRHGYAVTARGLVHRDYDEQFYRSLAERLADLGYARFLMLPTIDLRSMSTLLRLLAEGQTVLLFADAFIDVAAKRDLMRYLGSDLKLYRPSQIAVDLLGRTVSANRGVGWLAETSGAPVVPVAVLERQGGREALVLRPPLPASTAATAPERIADTVRRIYAELEALVRENPTQWWYWKSLHKMEVEREPGRIEPISSRTADVC
jgi:lauroyl/myristoyl acyltransferase